MNKRVSPPKGHPKSVERKKWLRNAFSRYIVKLKTAKLHGAMLCQVQTSLVDLSTFYTHSDIEQHRVAIMKKRYSN